MALYRHCVLTRHIDVTANFPEELICRVDQQANSRVIANLIDNALRVTTNSGSILIEVGKCEDGFISFSVSNSGEEIALEIRTKLFKRFIQGSQGRRTESGYGLGLYLGEKIVQAQGGRISFGGADVYTFFAVILPGRIVKYPSLALHVV